MSTFLPPYNEQIKGYRRGFSLNAKYWLDKRKILGINSYIETLNQIRSLYYIPPTTSTEFNERRPSFESQKV